MSVEGSSDPSRSGGERSREEAFWERYRRVVRPARVEDGVAVWYRRHVEGFIRFLKPRRLREAEAASTQNQALNALLFFFREGLGRQLGQLGEFERAKRSRKLPVVLSRQEIQRVLSKMEGGYRLMASLMYGAGLRLMEWVRCTSQRRVIRCGTVLRRICWRAGMTSGRCRS